jgi:aspartate aminotransferase
MSVLSNRVSALTESATLGMTRLSRKLKAEGKDVINLSIGEPDFNTPVRVKEAAKKAIDDNQTHYAPVSGIMELRKAIAKKLKEENGLDFKPEQVVVCNGAKQAIANAMLSLVDPGDEVIVPAPYWVSYPELVKLAGGRVVELRTQVGQDFKITPGQLEEAITEKTKVMIYSSPCNPTGSFYTKDELKALATVIERHPRLMVISDEIYEYINFTGRHESLAQFPEVSKRVITVNGVSKGYAMTGWRIGYLAAPVEIAEACDTLQGQITSAASTISQLAALQALDSDDSVRREVNNMIAAFRERRDLVLSLMKDIPGFVANVPAGAFYIFPDVSYYFGKSNGHVTIRDCDGLSSYLLNTVYVATVPGSAFGDDRCIRISYATSKENLIKAFGRIREALATLN